MPSHASSMADTNFIQKLKSLLDFNFHFLLHKKLKAAEFPLNTYLFHFVKFRDLVRNIWSPLANNNYEMKFMES
jgi:hypothetical protein